MRAESLENRAGECLSRRIRVLEGDDSLAIGCAQRGVVRVGGVEREAVVVAGDDLAQEVFDGLEIADHVAGIEGVGRENNFDSAAVSVGEPAGSGVLGEQVTAFDDESFGNTERHSSVG